MITTLLHRKAFVVLFAFMLSLVPAVAAQAQTQIDPVEPEYYFEQDSSDCGDYAPINPELKQRTNGDRHEARVSFEITQEQIDAANCAGSHFDLQIRLAGFDPSDDWSECSVDTSHEYIIDKNVVDGGDGTATATIYGAKLTDERLKSGDGFWAEVDCPELWPGNDDPSVTVDYVGTWWSTNVDAPNCEETKFVTSGTNGPKGLPVCVEYSGQTAELVDADGDEEFPFDY